MDVNEYEQQSNFPLRHKGRHGHDHMVVKNISVILWWSVLLMEETGVLGIPTFRLYLKFIYAVFWFILCSENHRPVASQWQAIIVAVLH
jgi:hypothetical protein